MLDIVIFFLLLAAIIPLLLAIYFYVTRPSPDRRWLRVFSGAWLNPVGIQIVLQKAALVLILTFILATRFFGDFPGRQLIAWGLYTVLVVTFWRFLFLQRSIQKPFERRRDVRQDP